jgi:hypothetical protein
MEALEGEVRALKEENARLREALRALEPPRRRPWWRFWGYPHSAPPSLQETISPCPQQAHRSLVMGGQVEDKGPALQLHQAHPDEELEDPAQGGSLSTELPPGSDGAIGFALRKLPWALQTDRLRESGSYRVWNSGSL